MNVETTKLPGVVVIEPRVFGDDRGFFLETFQEERYRAKAGIEIPFVQDNYSRSRKGILRGMHFQKKHPQGKLVQCVRGEVFDVVVDIEPDSSTFGVWEGFYLSEENRLQVYVPPGYAHGFAVISDVADFQYKCTDYYAPQHEGCLRWDDPEVGIEWPIENPLLSEKDREGQSLAELFGGA